MPVLKPDQLHSLIVDTLERCNTSKANAQSVARALVDAELVGQAGHGSRRIPSYAAQAASGKVDGHAVPQMEQLTPAMLAVDAMHGFAYPAFDTVYDAIRPMVRESGIAIAGISRSHHCGVAGVIVERYADMGFVALLFANTPAAIAPWGGSRASFGTNPIAFAAPIYEGDLDDGEETQPGSIVVDVSLSKVARGKIMAAKQKGESIPEGWALGPDGSPTTDPNEALAGTMVPLGDAKGTALALMVELLSAGLNRSNFASQASSFFEAEGPSPGVGQTLIVIDPQKLGGTGVFRHFRTLAEDIMEQEGARLPGHRRQELRHKYLSQGFEIDAALLAEVDRIGR